MASVVNSTYTVANWAGGGDSVGIIVGATPEIQVGQGDSVGMWNRKTRDPGYPFQEYE